MYGSTVLKTSGNLTTKSGSISASLTDAERATLYNQCKSSNTLTTLKFRIYTKNSTNGSSESYRESNTFTMNVVSSNPSWSSQWTVTSSDDSIATNVADTKLTALTGSTSSNPRFVLGYSNLVITIPASAAVSKNPTENMNKYTFSATGYSLSEATHSTSAAITRTLSKISTTNISVRAIDKRR